jgi:porin
MPKDIFVNGAAADRPDRGRRVGAVRAIRFHCLPGRRAGSAPAPPSVRLPRRRERNGKKAVQAGSGAPRAAAALLLFSALLPTPAEAEPAAALLGDSGGLRTVLARYGAALDLSETSEVFGNLTGGLHRGFAYDGLTSMALTLDAGKAFGWTGGTFHVSAFQIHGLNLTARNLDVLQTISNIEADRATRLWELWYRQTLPGMDADVKFGQQSVDQEFLVSDYAGLFINAMNGWPALPSNDLYAGGPVYPLSSLGIRLRAKPAMGLTVLAGVFDDNPPGGSFFNDLQVRDGEASGTRFNLGTGALFLGEIQYAVAHPPFAGRRALPGTYKLGVWADTGPFPDQRFDTAGLSLAAPASTGIARLDRGNFSLYGVVDQTVWQPDPAAARALGVFVRAMGAPGDRNLVDFALNAGVALKAPWPGREDDQFGIAYGLAHISGRAAALDRDRAFFAGLPFPVRSNEQTVEITYLWQLTRWWQLQPDFQYVFHPGGGVGSPADPTRRLGDEAILGLRTRITF